jgi:hypothetical protein
MRAVVTKSKDRSALVHIAQNINIGVLASTSMTATKPAKMTELPPVLEHPELTPSRGSPTT